MTRKQRFMAALRGEQPDVVAVAPLIHCRFANTMLGRTDWRAVFEVHQMIGSCHHRGPVGVSCHWEMPQGWRSGSELLEQDGPRKLTRQTMHTPLGDLTSRTVSGFAPNDPIISKPIEYMVKGPEDWKVVRAWHEKRLEGFKGYNCDVADEAWGVMGEDGVASCGMSCALGHVGGMRGMQDMLYDLVDYPDLMESVRQAMFAGIEKTVEAFLESRSEVLFFDICWVTGADMGPQMVQRWCLPEVQRIVEMVHARPGKYVGLYTLGKIRKLLPMLVDTGVDFIETFEPNQGDISLREGMDLYGERTCLMGNFDCVVLARGTVDQARAEAHRCLDEAVGRGRYVMVTGDEVPADARIENLKAMVETVEQYGSTGGSA